MGQTDIKRMVLLALLFFIGIQLWAAWQKDHASQMTANITNQTTSSIVTSVNANVPSVPSVLSTTKKTPENKTAVPTSLTKAEQSTVPLSRVITIKTDVLRLTIDKSGGNVVESQLLAFPEKLHSSDPFVLLNNNKDTLYTAQSGLTGKNGPDTATYLPTYHAAQKQYQLKPGQNTLKVPLTYTDQYGVTYTKTYEVTRNHYTVNVNYKIDNKSAKPWQGHLYTQLQHKPENSKTTFLGLHTFTGASLSNDSKKYDKISYSKLEDENIDLTSKGGWFAFQQHYFLNAWVMPKDQKNHYYSQFQKDSGLYTLGGIGSEITVPSGATLTQHVKLYSGPEDAKRLEKVAPHLDLTIDYGIFWVISSSLFWLMRKIHFVVQNWGWSIVLLTIFVRLVFYKLSVISYRSMGKMRLLQPKIKALKERYPDDKQQFSKSIMELYKKEKVNPLSGCLPILIQIPVFIGLYWALIESVELRQAPWILWIQDLSARDPLFILPLLMGVTMFLQQKLSPPPPDPTQAKMMMMLPIVFTGLFLYFPAGLVLYWVTNNTFSITQQWYIMRKLDLEQKKGSFKNKKKR